MLDTFLHLGVLIILLVVLIKSADLVEDAFVFISKRLHISGFFTGFVILGAVTSLPELSITAMSSNTNPELSLGNLLGASLILFTFVLGLTAVKYKSIPFKGRFGQGEVFLALTLTMAGIIVLIDRQLSFADGILLLGGYIIYVLYISKKFDVKNEIKKKRRGRKPKNNPIYLLITKAFIGVILILVSSNLIVDEATIIAEAFNVNSALIGLFILAIGTNLPELAFLLFSKKTDQESSKLNVGNFFGSAYINIGILGVLGIFSGGFEITNFITIVPVIVILVIAILLFGILSWTDTEITRKEGFLLIALYLSFIITQGILMFAG